MRQGLKSILTDSRWRALSKIFQKLIFFKHLFIDLPWETHFPKEIEQKLFQGQIRAIFPEILVSENLFNTVVYEDVVRITDYSFKDNFEADDFSRIVSPETCPTSSKVAALQRNDLLNQEEKIG